MENNHDSFAEKVEDRLDEIFGETEPVPEVVEENTDLGYYPLRFLKATVLSIDWEITDEVMARFIEQVERLKETHKDDNILVPLLQMLHSTGRHIRIYRENSHQDSLKVLKSIYVAVEKVLTDKDLETVDKKKTLSKEITKFQALKAQIAAGHLGRIRKQVSATGTNVVEPGAPGAVETAKEPGFQLESGISRDFLLSALEEIKQLIREEFEALRADLK